MCVVCKYRKRAQGLTKCVHEASGSLLVVTAAFTAGVNNRHAVLGRCRRLRGAPLVVRVAAAGAVVAAGGRGAVGVGGAVAAAQLVHHARFCHQFCTRQARKNAQGTGVNQTTGTEITDPSRGGNVLGNGTK